MANLDTTTKRRILIIDDTVDIHKDIHKILCPDTEAAALAEIEQRLFESRPAPQSGLQQCFQIDSAYQGKEGLARVQQAVSEGFPYSLAFVDVRMPPGWDGIETVRHLWSVQPDLQVIICTAYSDHSWEDIVAELGASDSFVILKKPFDNIEVLQLAHALTKKWILGKQAQLRMGELDAMVAKRTAELRASNEQLHDEIGRRTRIEMELRGSEHRFQLAFKASAIPMAIMHAPTRTYLEVNEGFTLLLGREREEILGQSPTDLEMLAHPEDYDLAMELTRRNGKVRDHPCRIRTKAGESHETLISLEPVVLGEETCVLVAMLDITEQKKLEAQLRQSQKMDAIGQLAAGVAHDFNNLLTIIHGHASLQMSRCNHDEQTLHSLTQVKLAADRAATLTRQLLAFSRKQVMQFRPLCLNSAIEHSQAMLRRLLGETIRLECTFERDLPPVLADSNSIGQVMMNLAVNARDAMPEGGRLHISTRRVLVTPSEASLRSEARVGEHAVLTVADTGYGMDTTILSRIFEPFFTTKPPGKGTGLGLSTVYGIVKQHNGWMDVESAPGLGTRFHIYFAVTDEPADSAEEVVPHSPLTSMERKTETILVVEDEPVLREFVTSVLESHGYSILQAGDGVEALQIARDNNLKIDLLLTDMVMPNGVSGIHLANQLRANREGIKVLFTSGYSQELMDNAGELLTANNFLPKPFDVNRLLGTVRHCLEGSPATADNSPQNASLNR